MASSKASAISWGWLVLLLVVACTMFPRFIAPPKPADLLGEWESDPKNGWAVRIRLNEDGSIHHRSFMLIRDRSGRHTIPHQRVRSLEGDWFEAEIPSEEITGTWELTGNVCRIETSPKNPDGDIFENVRFAPDLTQTSPAQFEFAITTHVDGGFRTEKGFCFYRR